MLNIRFHGCPLFCVAVGLIFIASVLLFLQSDFKKVFFLLRTKTMKRQKTINVLVRPTGSRPQAHSFPLKT